jgi:hypothetical protein
MKDCKSNDRNETDYDQRDNENSKEKIQPIAQASFPSGDTLNLSQVGVSGLVVFKSADFPIQISEVNPIFFLKVLLFALRSLQACYG